MTRTLDGKRAAILASDGFEQAELMVPLQALRSVGAEVDIISLKRGPIQGFNHLDRGDEVEANLALSEADADADDYDALVLPGGANNPDRLRIEDAALDFVRAFMEAEKPTAVICHAPWILINAGLVKGRTLTSYKTIRADLANAGATVVDQEVVVDGNLITSRDPNDLPAFCAALVEQIAEGPSARA
jgi:protease I